MWLPGFPCVPFLVAFRIACEAVFAHGEQCCVLLNKWAYGFSSFLSLWVFVGFVYVFFISLPKRTWSPGAHR